MVSFIHYWLVTNLLQHLPTLSPLHLENASPIVYTTISQFSVICRQIHT